MHIPFIVPARAVARCAMVAALFGAAPALAQAAAAAASAGVAAAQQTMVDAKNGSRPPAQLLGVELNSSRPQHTAGTTVGINATLTNLSQTSTLYLTPGSVVLMQPPELEGPFARNRALSAYFPVAEGDTTVLVLSPGTSAQVTWRPIPYGDAASDTSRSLTWYRFIDETGDQILNELKFIFFSPGEYEVAVQAKYWTDSKRPALQYAIASQRMKVKVAAPQFVILLGAALGGLIAYLIFPHRRTSESVQQTTGHEQQRYRRDWLSWHKTAGTAGGAMLWSAIVTILLSRLSETQFVVRVTVADFWGAIAIGLVAQYAGAKWLERLLPTPSDATSGSRANAPAGDGRDDAEGAPADDEQASTRPAGRNGTHGDGADEKPPQKRRENQPPARFEDDEGATQRKDGKIPATAGR